MGCLRVGLAATACWLVASTGAGAQVSAGAAPRDSVAEALRALELVEGRLAFQGAFRRGDFTVAATDTLRGPLVVLHGNAEVRGTVLGNVTAVFGDVLVHDGADVHGSASAWRGRVVVDGGRVRGAMGARPTAAARSAEPPRSTGEALRLAAGWTAVLVIIGLVALVLLGRNLDTTARLLEQDFGRAFLAGVLGQVAFLPLVLLAVTALAVTILGILLIPFVLAAVPVAFAGLVTLGLLAMALLIGRALMSAGTGYDRNVLLRAVVPGVLILMAPWLLAAGLQETGVLAVIARAAAAGITWVAATAGLGAALLSRAGTSSPAPARAASAPANASWQTPTPVAGVAAARRPVPARPESMAK